MPCRLPLPRLPLLRVLLSGVASLVMLPWSGAHAAQTGSAPDDVSLAPLGNTLVEPLDSLTGLRLSVSATGTGRPWVLRVDNPTERPVQVVNDTRLLWFEVSAPGARATKSCRLPDEMVPLRLRRRAWQTLPPGGFLLRQFDPRLYCFSSGAQTALVPGAQLTPYFGWPNRTKTTWQHGRRVTRVLDPEPPYVAEVLDADENTTSAARHLTGAPLFLGPEYHAWSAPEADSKERPLSLHMTGGSDAASERDVTVRLALQNLSGEPVYLYYRRELTDFVVHGPDGPAACRPDGSAVRSADPQELIRLAAHEKVEVPIRLVELCPRGTFDRPGLYYVHAMIDAPAAVDAPDKDIFVGEIHAPTPALVRVRTGEQPFLLTPRGRSRDVAASAQPLINVEPTLQNGEAAPQEPPANNAAEAPAAPAQDGPTR